MMAQSSPPPPTSLSGQTPTQTFAIESGDPIWQHVKTDWDRQFVQRPNFIPWLRAQLLIDPIDEQSPNAEPLVSYIKRRLALIQAQHQSAPDVKPAPSSSPSMRSEPTNLAYASCVPHAGQPAIANVHRPIKTAYEDTSCPPIQPTNSGTPANSNGSIMPSATNTLKPNGSSQGPSPQTSNSFGSTTLSSQGYTSQLGAIADAHMGSPSTPQAPMRVHNRAESSNNVSNLAPQPMGHEYPNFLSTFSTEFYGQPTQQLHDQRSSAVYQEHEEIDAQQQRYPQQSQLQKFQQPQQNHALQQQLNQQDLQRRLLQHHQNQILPSPQIASLASPIQASRTPEQMGQANQMNSFQASQPHSTDHNGFLYLTNQVPHRSHTQSPAVDQMSLIHPQLVLGGQHTIATAFNLARTDPEPSFPSIPPAVPSTSEGISFNLALSATSKREESQTRPVRQTRNTRSNAAVAKKAVNIDETPISSATSKVSKTAAPVTLNGTDQSGQRPAPPTLGSSVIPAPKLIDHYDRKAWKSRLSTLRSELDHITKIPTRTANKLIKILSMFTTSPTPLSGDSSTVPPDGRLEVLSAIKTSATREFFSAWTSESKGLALLEAWLKGSVHAHEKAKVKSPDVDAEKDHDAVERDTVLVSLLQMLEKLPITLDNLKNHTFAKQVLRINKEVNAPKFSATVKNLSVQLEQKWRAAVRDAAASKAATLAATARDPKKRNEPSLEQAEVKKRKVELATKGSAGPTASTSRVHETLFGMPDRAKLPAFSKKKVEQVAAPLPTPQIDPFAEAMAALKERNTNAGLGEMNVPASNAPKIKANGKSTKRVTFASDEKLCQIKIVERLVYEGEDYAVHPLGDARKMDAIEGRYLHHTTDFMEEEMEWESPAEVVLTEETIANLETSPLESPEAAIQDEREKSVVEVTYYDESQIPDTPQEPPVGEEGSEDNNALMPKMMKLGGDLLVDPEVPRLIARAHADNTAANAPVAPDHAVSDILARLNGPQLGMAGPGQKMPPTAFHAGIDINLLNSLSQAGPLQALLAASSQTSMAPLASPIAAPLAPNPFRGQIRDNGWGAAAGSARMSSSRDHHIPTGPSAGVGGGKKKGRKHRVSAYDQHGRHIRCKWWPDCPHGARCYYKHGD